MKVILTEDQLKLVELIKENTDFSEKMKEAIMGAIKTANKMYNIITFTTLAEIRDGDTDISIIKQKFESLDDLNNKLRHKRDEFEQRYVNNDGDWPNPELKRTYDDMGMRLDKLNLKVDALRILIDALLPLSKIDKYGAKRDVDMYSAFNDVTATEI